ncbi:hemoblobin-interacting domain-containing protein [Cohnella sp. JJ-181]|uniref:hemoblobin-interacting domain-containing protein n=1 Tax=Cohnella rhizoplanae TaxID=2974897 RepID=UPI0022FFAD96|nr:hemoblobin-interacting domain-containing protein [Cohnella sp. JJ-181]CAI6086568.1 hypothetical protein COHCIP112018_05073 [Cohnella sp. JJ-181]
MKKVSIALMLAILIFASFGYAPAANAATTVDNTPVWTKCADEQGVCEFTGTTKEVRYGANGSYYTDTVTDGIACSNEAWEGDPAPSQRKQCDVRDLLPEGIPSVTGTLSDDFKTFAIRFDKSIEPAGTLDQLKSAITIQKLGSEDYEALGVTDTVAYDAEEPDTIVLTLASQLVGEGNAIRIAAGAVILNGEPDAYAAPIELKGIVGADIVPPAFAGAESGNNTLTLYFDEKISPVLSEDFDPENEAQYSAAKAEFQSKIQIAQDGEHFSPLVDGLVNLNWDSLVNPEWDGNYLQISYDNSLEIVSGSKTKIKLPAGLFKDAVGNVTPEMTLAVSPPSIMSAELSANNHDVTVTFDRNIYATPTYTPEDLKSSIWLLEDSGRSRDLDVEDTVEITEDQLKIHFETALNGDSNQIVIDDSTLRDVSGNYSSQDTVSPYLKAHAEGDASDTTAPELVDYLVSPDHKDITLLFNEPVIIPNTSLDQFKASVRWYDSNYGYMYGLPSDATVTIIEDDIKIHFETLSGSVLYMKFYLGYITDLKGNSNDRTFYTNWFDSANVSAISLSGYFDLNGRYLNLDIQSDYADQFVDLTVDENGSHLKEKIKISTDNGVTFKSLSEADKVILDGSRIAIFLHDRVTAGTMQVKLEADALMDSHHYQANDEIRQTIAYNTPSITGYLFSDADTVLKYEENAEWSAHITSIKIMDRTSYSSRTLTASEYEISGGKLTIYKGVFLKGRAYQINVAADGYSSQGFSGNAYKSSDIFYMTAPTVTKSSGITASVFIYNRAFVTNFNNNPFAMVSESSSSSAGTQSVVFELFDGDTPVSIVAAELAVGTGTYTAKFSVSDAASVSRNYTVKAFIVSSFDAETHNVGLNLGTVKTQSEIDEALMLSQNNNKNDD